MATTLVPSANLATSNMPIGPFHNTVRASRMCCVYTARVLPPMSRPIRCAGMARSFTSMAAVLSSGEVPHT